MEKLVERTSTVVSLLTAALLFVSVSSDYGYLHGLSLSFAVVPTTIADHARGAAIWIPPVGSALVVGLAIAMFLRDRESAARHRRATKTFRVGLFLLVAGALVLLMLLSRAIFDGDVIVLLLAGFTMLFATLVFHALGGMVKERRNGRPHRCC